MWEGGSGVKVLQLVIIRVEIHLSLMLQCVSPCHLRGGRERERERREREVVLSNYDVLQLVI